MSDCERYEEMISALLDGELSEAESAELRDHMATCAHCSAMYKAFADVGAAVAQQEVPATLHDGIMARVRASEKAHKTQSKIVRLRPILAAAACLVVLVGTVFALKNNLGKPRYAAANAAAKAAAPESMIYSAGGASGSTDAGAAMDAREEAVAESEQVLMSVAASDAAVPEAPMEATNDSAAASKERADTTAETLYGADAVYPTVMVNDALYEWHRGSAIRFEGLPDQREYYDDVTHTEEPTPQRNGEFASLFQVKGKIFTIPGDPDVVYLEITTDWMEDTVVRFDRIESD